MFPAASIRVRRACDRRESCSAFSLIAATGMVAIMPPAAVISSSNRTSRTFLSSLRRKRLVKAIAITPARRNHTRNLRERRVFMLFPRNRFVTDDFSRYHVNNHVRDPLGMIGDAFEGFRDLHNIEADLDIDGIRKHERHQFPKDLFVEVINHRILRPNPPRQFNVLPNHRVETVSYHGPAYLPHPGQINIRFELREIIKDYNLLGNIDHHVADSLQMAGDLDRRRNKAQVARRRLAQGKQANAPFLKFDIETVDLFITFYDLPRSACITLQERL